jgi:hypothetical protein
MKTIENSFKSEALKNFATLLKDNGFNVYVTKSTSPLVQSYFHFEFENNIGYVQTDESNYTNRLRFTSVHKPNRLTGTGFGLQDAYEGIENPTIEDAKEAFIIAPKWAKNKNSVIKYKNFEEFQAEKSKFNTQLIKL